MHNNNTHTGKEFSVTLYRYENLSEDAKSVAVEDFIGSFHHEMLEASMLEEAAFEYIAEEFAGVPEAYGPEFNKLMSKCALVYSMGNSTVYAGFTCKHLSRDNAPTFEWEDEVDYITVDRDWYYDRWLVNVYDADGEEISDEEDVFKKTIKSLELHFSNLREKLESVYDYGYSHEFANEVLSCDDAWYYASGKGADLNITEGR